MNEYKTAIPVMTGDKSTDEWKVTISELKRAEADFVFLVYYRTLENKSKKDEAIRVFVENKEILERAGFKVGAWFCPTVGYGSRTPGDNDAERYYGRIVGALGESTHAFCPLCEEFCDDLYDEFARVAKTGVKHILLEDDFTLTGGKLWVASPGCLCDEHLKVLSERTGEELTREKLTPYLTGGCSNKYRTEYLKLMAESLLKVAHGIERAVHTVAEDIRIGFSSNSASYTLEGASAFDIARTLAGNLKPFVRLTAAPYWKNGPSLNSVTETARMQGAWFSSRGIDVMTEGDTYPRPRFLVSAAELEMYDTILRADGNSDAILKYMLDYTASADYETGYVDFHAENKAVYKEISERFVGDNVGLKVFEYPHSTEVMDFDDSFDYMGLCDHGTLPFLSQWFVTDNSIPTTYGETDGAALVFGTNALFLTDEDLNRGLILDVKAARILEERGVDVGFESIEETVKPSGEYFVDENDSTVVSTEREGGFFKFRLKENAVVLSKFYVCGEILSVAARYKEEFDNFPSCYIYENENKQRFMIYTFAPTYVKSKSEWHNGIFRNYYRQSQLIRGYEWLCGKPLPAVCEKNPGLYILCKRDKNKLNVGIWNISNDKINNPTVVLDKEYSEKSFSKGHNCSGRIKGRKAELVGTLYPYEFVFFSVSERD